MTGLVAWGVLALFVLNVAALAGWAAVERPRLVLSAERGMRAWMNLTRGERSTPATVTEPDPAPATVDEIALDAWLAEVEATEQAANERPADPWRDWAHRGASVPPAAGSCRQAARP